MNMKRLINIVTEGEVVDFGPPHERRRREVARQEIERARNSEPVWPERLIPYKESNKPSPGDEVIMDFDHDTQIEVSRVPNRQPYADRGIWVIYDQYDEKHYVEHEDESGQWLTTNPETNI